MQPYSAILILYLCLYHEERRWRNHLATVVWGQIQHPSCRTGWLCTPGMTPDRKATNMSGFLFSYSQYMPLTCDLHHTCGSGNTASETWCSSWTTCSTMRLTIVTELDLQTASRLFPDPEIRANFHVCSPTSRVPRGSFSPSLN